MAVYQQMCSFSFVLTELVSAHLSINTYIRHIFNTFIQSYLPNIKQIFAVNMSTHLRCFVGLDHSGHLYYLVLYNYYLLPCI